jgi:hypothetical protein
MRDAQPGEARPAPLGGFADSFRIAGPRRRGRGFAWAVWSSAKTPPAQQAKSATSTVPVSWIPIDSDLVLGECYQPTPEKAAAVVDAKKSLQGGDSSKALQAIGLAAIDIDYTVAVAPLKQSVADLNEAVGFVASRDFYGASQSLMKAEDGVRYDEFDDVANVNGNAAAAK